MSSTPHIVIEEGHWFLNSHSIGNDRQREYEVDYRYAICYSLLNYLCPPKDGEKGGRIEPLLEPEVREQGKIALQHLQKAIVNREYWQKDNFLEAVPFEYERNGSSRKGYVIIDKADGMYPLVLYSENSGRLEAYRNALDDVLSLYENYVYPLLKKYAVTGWNQEFQGEVKTVPWNYQADQLTTTTVEV